MISFFLLKRQIFDILLTTKPFIAVITSYKLSLKNLKHGMINASKLCKVNSMKANPKKFQFMILGKGTRQTVILNINNIRIREPQNVELLGLIIDNRLRFKDHINMLCRRANYKLHALRRIRKYLTIEKSKLLYNAFINNQFNYASII